jgi:hypothetical protein
MRHESYGRRTTDVAVCLATETPMNKLPEAIMLPTCTPEALISKPSGQPATLTEVFLRSFKNTLEK